MHDPGPSASVAMAGQSIRSLSSTGRTLPQEDMNSTQKSLKNKTFVELLMWNNVREIGVWEVF